MERLTKRDPFDGIVELTKEIWEPIAPYDEVIEALSKLAAYEDTGLEPEEIKELCTDEVAEIAHMFRKMIHSGEIDHLNDLLKAEQEGHLLVLPCKVGDTVFSAFENEDVFCGKVYAISTCDGTNWFSVRYDSGLRYDHTWDEIGKTVFLTREEAEKALEEMNNG